ncbi:MAG: hypothetical protein J07HB67_02489 [halophilic archaeon J07HB67]|nr:MAG: hypothetical protein J07HB67_02489 [halophilic archaeon J07HB67]
MKKDESPKWRNNRERITYEEARRVLEAQKSDISDMDDKALRTVRATALLLGAGAAAARVTGTERLNTSVTILSVVSFLLSVAFGVVVYNESKEVIGPTSRYIGRLRRDDMSAAWEQDLLAQLDGWIDSNQEVVEYNRYLLQTCLVFFVLGIGFGTAALLSLDLFNSLMMLVIVLSVLVVLAPLFSRRAG